MFILQLLVLKFLSIYHLYRVCYGRSQWPSGLRRRFAAARLLRSWVRIPPGAWIFVCCECCVLSGRGLCDELVTRPEESYRMWCVVVCDLESSRTRRPWPALGRSTAVKKKESCVLHSHISYTLHLNTLIISGIQVTFSSILLFLSLRSI